MSAETPIEHVAETAGENVVEIRKLLNKVSNFVLHRDLDFDVRAGEVMTLVGGSGSGKTRLVRVIFGLKQHAQCLRHPTAHLVIITIEGSAQSLLQITHGERRIGCYLSRQRHGIVDQLVVRNHA